MPESFTLESLEVLFIAQNTASVNYTGAQRLSVNGNEVGEVEYLAVARERVGDKNYLLLFMNELDSFVGLIKINDIEEGKLLAEKYYSGITSNWIPARSDAASSEKNAFELDQCSFCKKKSREVFRLYGTEDAVICDECIEAFYEWVREDKNLN